MDSENVTNFDPDRKRKPMPAVPNVAPPMAKWQDLSAAQLAGDLLSGKSALPINDAKEIAEKLAREYLTLFQQNQMVMTQLNTMTYVLDRIGGNAPRVDGGMD